MDKPYDLKTIVQNAHKANQALVEEIDKRIRKGDFEGAEVNRYVDRLKSLKAEIESSERHLTEIKTMIMSETAVHNAKIERDNKEAENKKALAESMLLDVRKLKAEAEKDKQEASSFREEGLKLKKEFELKLEKINSLAGTRN